MPFHPIRFHHVHPIPPHSVPFHGLRHMVSITSIPSSAFHLPVSSFTRMPLLLNLLLSLSACCQFFEARGIQDCQSVPVEKEWKQALSNYGVCEHELYPLDHIFTKWASGRLKGKIFSQCQGNFNWFQRLFLLKTSSLSWVALIKNLTPEFFVTHPECRVPIYLGIHGGEKDRRESTCICL